MDTSPVPTGVPVEGNAIPIKPRELETIDGVEKNQNENIGLFFVQSEFISGQFKRSFSFV